MQKVFGISYVNEVALKHLIGDGGQADYNEYLAASLIVTVPEALIEDEDRSKWQSRHLAYERLKNICDPISQRTMIKRKYGRNSIEWIYASLLISSNHTDALAVERDDRRLIVIDNGNVPLTDAPAALFDRIQAWQTKPVNIAALHRHLVDRAATGVAYNPFGHPPETRAKNRMIESSRNDIDRLYEAFIESCEGDIVSPAQWRDYAYRERASGDYDLPVGDKFENSITAVIRSHARRIESLPASGLKVDGKVIRPWIIRRANVWEGSTSKAKIREQIEKNGKSGADVVNFQK